MIIENSDPVPLKYLTLLEVPKKELTQNPKKSLVSFCEKHSINDHFNRWFCPLRIDYVMKYAWRLASLQIQMNCT